MTREVTAREYARELRISVDVARGRLRRMVENGTAKSRRRTVRRTGWNNAARLVQEVVYTLPDEL